MSYCRWSSDAFQCDVYVYEDASGGWTTHVAGRRVKHAPPESLTSMKVTASTALDYWAALDAWRGSLPKDEHGDIADSEYLALKDIGPEAGESYNDPTPSECADRLEGLRAKGFNVPQYAIDALREEALESASADDAVGQRGE